MITTKKTPIGVFDSGCGGLTVLRVLQERFPHEDFVYYADTAHLPYGTKSPEQIQAYTHTALTWLQNIAQVKLIIVACHTSSALAIKLIQDQFYVPIIDMIDPLTQAILRNAQYKKIGIIATPASAASRMHEKHLYDHGFTGSITSISCPDFVPLIEAPAYDTTALTAAAQKYLTCFRTEELDTLVYGCTHYPLIASIIKPLLPATMQYVDPAYAVADAVAQMLQEHACATQPKSLGTTRYYCTGDAELFAAKVNMIMENKNIEIFEV